MKKNIYKFILLVVSIAFVSCDSEQAGQDVEPVGSTERYPTPTFTFDGATTVNEGDETVLTYTINFDRAINRPIDFTLVQTGGTATEHEDFDFVNTSVPAYGTTATAQIIIYNDNVIEGDETLSFDIISGPSLANRFLVNPETQFPATKTITIQNYESPDLDLVFDWDRLVNYAGTDYHTCGNFDIDVYVSTTMSTDDIIADYDAATGDCPETWTFSGYDDGEYYFMADLYENGFEGLSTNADVPITITATRGGVWTETYVQPVEDAYNTDDIAADAPVVILFKLTVGNGDYTIEMM